MPISIAKYRSMIKSIVQSMNQILPNSDFRFNKEPRFIVDITHLDGRVVSGLERIAQDLFTSQSIYAGARVTFVRGGSRLRLIFEQWIGIPLRLLFNRKAFLVCTGFPPSIIISAFFGRRTALYVYDTFLMTRKSELNWRALIYLAPSFHFAIKRLRFFFVLTSSVLRELQGHIRSDAQTIIWRAPAHDVFRLGIDARDSARKNSSKVLKVCSIGTVEPRKNYLVAAQICARLSDQIGIPVKLDIIGRYGWGEDYALLKSLPHVTLHNYLPDEELKALVVESDFFLYATRAEGLGLPAVEVQHGGVPIVANDLPVLREVLGESALFIDVDNVDDASRQLAAHWRSGAFDTMVALSLENVDRWNLLAKADKKIARSFFEEVLTQQ